MNYKNAILSFLVEGILGHSIFVKKMNTMTQLQHKMNTCVNPMNWMAVFFFNNNRSN